MATGEGSDVGRTSGMRRRRLTTAVRRASPATLLLVATMAISAATLLGLGARLSFLGGDWDLLVNRRGFSADSILVPYDGGLVIGPVLVYKALLAVFGMGSALPFRLVAVAAFLASVGVLYVFLRERVGEWLALAGAAVVLLLGPAADDLLWALHFGYFVSMGAGLGALLALERRSPRGDLAACGLLCLAVLFSNLGVPFVIAAAVALALGPRGARSERAFVVVAPAGLLAIWWLGWGIDGASVSLENIATSPIYLADGLASAISSMLGLATPRDESRVGALDWGRPLLVAAIGLAAWRLWRLRRLDSGLIVVIALAASFWLLAGAAERAGSDPLAGRYQYIGVVFVLMLAAQLLAGIRLRGPALAAVYAVAALAVFSNLSFLHQAYSGFRATSQIERADLAAVEIARDTIAPDFRIDGDVARTSWLGIDTGPYLAASDDFGSPAYTEAELTAAPPFARAAADSVLAAGLGLTAVAGGATGGECQSVVVAPGAAQILDVPVGGASVANRGDDAIALRLRRFGDEFEIGAGTVAAGGTQTVAIPADRSTRPWQLELSGTGPVTVCAIAGGGT